MTPSSRLAALDDTARLTRTDDVATATSSVPLMKRASPPKRKASLSPINGDDSDVTLDGESEGSPAGPSKKVRFASPVETGQQSPKPSISPYYAELLSYFDSDLPAGTLTYTGKMYVELYTRDGRALYYSSCVQTRQKELLLYADPEPSLPHEKTAAGLYGPVPDLFDEIVVREDWSCTSFYTRRGERLLVRRCTPWPTFFVTKSRREIVPLLMYRPQYAPRREPSSDSEPDSEKNAYTLDGAPIDHTRTKRRKDVERLLAISKILDRDAQIKSAGNDDAGNSDSESSGTCVTNEDDGPDHADVEVEVVDVDSGEVSSDDDFDEDEEDFGYGFAEDGDEVV